MLGETGPESDRKRRNAAAKSEVSAARLAGRSLVLVGMMGAGKSSVGRRLAQRLGLPFVDSDNAIEEAAGMTVAEIFALRGEAEFRAGERKVLARLLGEPSRVIATGGGAFMDGETRALVRERAVSIWLKADLPVLLKRVKRRADRPLLKSGDPEGVLRRLLEERSPVYAEADLTVLSEDTPHEAVVERIICALDIYLGDPHLTDGR